MCQFAGRTELFFLTPPREQDSASLFGGSKASPRGFRAVVTHQPRGFNATSPPACCAVLNITATLLSDRHVESHTFPAQTHKQASAVIVALTS